MAKIFYVLEKYLIDTDESEDWEEKLKQEKVEYAIVKRVPLVNNFDEAFPDGLPEQCQNGSGYIPIYYCTIEMCRLLRLYAEEKNLNLTGLFYPGVGGISCFVWREILDDAGIPLVNNGFFTTCYDLIEDWNNIFAMNNSNALFIKPNSGDKVFQGKVWYDYEKEKFIKFIQDEAEENRQRITDIYPELVFVNEPVKIKAEYRFFILNQQVICGSQYRRNSILDKRIDVMPKAKRLANKVADIPRRHQADTFYACDIAELENGEFKVLELNAGSCSGLYQHNKSLIIKAFKRYFKIW